MKEDIEIYSENLNNRLDILYEDLDLLDDKSENSKLLKASILNEIDRIESALNDLYGSWGDEQSILFNNGK